MTKSTANAVSDASTSGLIFVLDGASRGKRGIVSPNAHTAVLYECRSCLCEKDPAADHEARGIEKKKLKKARVMLSPDVIGHSSLFDQRVELMRQIIGHVE